MSLVWKKIGEEGKTDWEYMLFKWAVLKPMLFFRGFFNLFLVYPLSFIVPFLRQRRLFEDQNRLGMGHESFKLSGRKAHFCFEVSSEGELEQILPLVRALTSQGKSLEIVYCSASVEKKIQQLAGQYPAHLKVQRLPLVTYMPAFIPFFGQNLKNWVTAPCFIFCRYDFFPELLLLAQAMPRGSVVLHATLKGKKWSGLHLFNYLYWRGLYGIFKRVVTAGPCDQKRFLGLGISAQNLFELDLRTLQIGHRLQASTVSSSQIFAPMNAYLEKLQKTKRGQRLILGSAYLQDLVIFKNQEFAQALGRGEYAVAIVPHRLDKDYVAQMMLATESYLKQNGVDIAPHMIGESRPESAALNSPVVLVTKRGILCELYAQFGQAYVGGGFERSIHSVLEPYLAGCRVMVGPMIHRSTEIEIISELSPESVVVFSSENEMQTSIFKYLQQWRQGEAEQVKVQDKSRKLLESYRHNFELLLEYLNQVNKEKSC